MALDSDVAVYDAFSPPPKHVLVCRDPSLTKQSELASTDVNRIVAQFQKTGMLPQGRSEGLYLDVSYMGGYQQALDQVRAVRGFFDQLPAAVRAEFENDPAVFLDFAADPANKPRLVELGVWQEGEGEVEPVPEVPAPPSA